MADVTREHILNTLALVYGGVPYGWSAPDKFSAIDIYMSSFPPIEGRQVPLSTFLLFAKTQLRIDLIATFATVFSEKLKNSFSDHLTELSRRANVQAGLDDGNFKAEVAAFGDIAKAVLTPHLEISALYRYMAAMQQSLLDAVTDELVKDAVAGLRENPYLSFAYGKAFLQLMPIAWEAL